MSDSNLEHALAILEPIRTVKLSQDSDAYESILRGLLLDLDKPNTMSVILCEQIAECVYWLRRHTADKELVILESMAKQISIELRASATSVSQLSLALSQGPGSSQYNDLSADLMSHGRSIDDMRARAVRLRAKEISAADDLIHRQVQNLRHLQKSLDAIDIKQRVVKRMDLEIEQLERDMRVIEHESGKSESE